MLRALATRCVTAGRRGLASRVVNVGSVEAYDKLSTTGDLLVTNFTASWCGPCQAAAPVFDKLSEDHGGVIFCKVDIDDEDSATSSPRLKQAADLHFTKGGETGGQVQGADGGGPTCS